LNDLTNDGAAFANVILSILATYRGNSLRIKGSRRRQFQIPEQRSRQKEKKSSNTLNSKGKYLDRFNGSEPVAKETPIVDGDSIGVFEALVRGSTGLASARYA